MDVLISVIIPAYNSEKTIEKCIYSVLNQTYKNIEVIVVDDGSSDNTYNLLNIISKKDNRVNLFHIENGGVSNARNYGLKNANGKYVCFIDSDDWIDSEMIEDMLKCAVNKKCEIVRCSHVDDYESGFSKIVSLNELDDSLFVKKNGLYPQIIYEKLLYSKKSIQNYSVLLLIDIEVFNRGLFFDTSLYMLEDLFFYQKLLDFSNSLYFIDKSYYHYYHNSSSATKDKNKYIKNINGIIDCSIKLNDYLKDKKDIIDFSRINANLYKIITRYLIRIYILNGWKYTKEYLTELNDNQFYCNIKDNIYLKEFPLKIRMIIFALVMNNFLLIHLAFIAAKKAWKNADV